MSSPLSAALLFPFVLGALALSPLQAQAQEAPAEAAPFSSSPFDKGSRLWSVTAGASRDHSIGEIYLLQAGVYHYVFDRFALHYGGQFGIDDTKYTKDGAQGGVELGLRYHFLETRRWSFFGEGIAAAVLHEHPLTENSLRFNFDLQGGGGVSYRVTESSLVETGFRWHHLSNARVKGKERNLGYDGPMVYLGFKKEF